MFNQVFQMPDFPPEISGDDTGQRQTADQTLRLKQEIRRLEANLAKALLISEALWEIVREKLQMQEEQLYEKIYEIDMRDGAADGKNQRKAMPCPKCGRVVSPRYPACIYCGQAMDDSVFQMG